MTRTVLYVANSSLIGGANRVLMDMIAGVSRRRFAPLLVVPSDGPLVDWARRRQVPLRIVRDGDLRGRAGLWRRAAQLGAIALGAGARIVHAMDPTCYRAAGAAARAVGAARVCHIEFPTSPDELAWSFRHGPDAAIACHDRQAHEVLAALPPRVACRVVAIPNAVDVDRFQPTATPASPWRFGARHVVLIVGHLSEVKGHPTFLRAAAILQRQLGDCAFLLLGGETVSRGFTAALERLAAELGIHDRVHFLGWRDAVPEILAAADAVALPSRAEGLPLAVLEAMASAKPVVATPVGGVPDAIADGVTGALVPPDDPEALATALARFLANRDLADRIGAAARRRVEERFSLRAFLGRVESLYDDLAA